MQSRKSGVLAFKVSFDGWLTLKNRMDGIVCRCCIRDGQGDLFSSQPNPIQHHHLSNVFWPNPTELTAVGISNGFVSKRYENCTTQAMLYYIPLDYLARQACLSSRLYVLLLFLLFLFNSRARRPTTSEGTGSIITKFLGFVEIWLQIIDLTFVFQSLKGHFYGNQFLDRIGEIAIPYFHSAHWCWKIATPILKGYMAMIPLPLMEIWWASVH